MPRPTRPRLIGVVGVILLVLVGVAVWIGYTGLQAQRSLDDARLSLTSARDALLDRDLLAADAAIDAAGADTARARDATSGPVWRLATSLPGELSNSLQVVRGLAEAADDLARQVLPDALDGARTIDPERLRGPDGSFDLTVIEAAAAPVAASAAGADRVRSAVDDLPRTGVPAMVGDAHDELAEQVGDLASVLRGSATALELAPALLGEDRPRRFFLLVQQNAECRGTGGLPGGYAVIETAGGRLQVTAAGSRREITGGAVPVPPGVPEDFVTRYRHYGSFDILVNINVSPDLPVVSRLIAQRWRDATAQEIDGVIALDAQALAMILEGSAPLQLDGRQVPIEELVEYLAVGQYRDFAAPLGASGVDLTEQRQDALSEVARETAARLTSGGGDTASLLTGIGEALRSGHLRMASDDPVLQAGLRRSGADGGLPPGDRPLAYPVVFNSTGGKLEHFLDRSVRYTAGGCDAAVRSSTIEVTLTNRAPAEGLPPYVTIRNDGDGVRLTTENAVTLSVYTTPGATLRRATLDGAVLDPLDPALPMLRRFQEAGLEGYEIFVNLPREIERTLVLELDEPALPGEPVVPEQPLARPLVREVDVEAC